MTAAELKTYHERWLESKQVTLEPGEAEYDPRDEYTPRAGTAPALLLDVAKTLPQPFTFEQLVLAAHAEYPITFGMRSAPRHPDTNVVKTSIVGKRGLVNRGYLNKLGPNLYEVRQ